MKRASGLTSLVSSSAIFSSVHLGERARRWVRLAGAVAAPAGDGAIGSEPAGVVSAGAHLGERAHARRRLTEILSPESLAPSDVAAPASDRAVGAKSAAVVAPRAHLRDGARREQDQLRLRLGPGVGKVGLAGDGEDEPTQTQQANSAYGVLQRHGCRRSSVLSPAEPSCNVWAWANRCLQGGAPRAACRARGDHAARVARLPLGSLQRCEGAAVLRKSRHCWFSHSRKTRRRYSRWLWSRRPSRCSRTMALRSPWTSTPRLPSPTSPVRAQSIRTGISSGWTAPPAAAAHTRVRPPCSCPGGRLDVRSLPLRLVSCRALVLSRGPGSDGEQLDAPCRHHGGSEVARARARRLALPQADAEPTQS